MTESDPKTKFPKLKNCIYWGEGICAEIGCAAQALMENSVDLGDNPEATKRRDKIESEAKKAGCPVKLVRPKFKKS